MIDLTGDPNIMYIIDQLPLDCELRTGKHCNVQGYHAMICCIGDRFRDDESETWDHASHGPSLVYAVRNAYRRFTKQPEDLYEESDFEVRT